MIEVIREILDLATQTLSDKTGVRVEFLPTSTKGYFDKTVGYETRKLTGVQDLGVFASHIKFAVILATIYESKEDPSHFCIQYHINYQHKPNGFNGHTIGYAWFSTESGIRRNEIELISWKEG